jgi:hypothetical protein
MTLKIVRKIEMNRRFFTEKQYTALQNAIDNCESINDEQLVYATPKSNKTIVEDLYRAIIRNLDLQQKYFSASSAGWEVIVERDNDFNDTNSDIRVTIEKNNKPENYSWTLKYNK